MIYDIAVAGGGMAGLTFALIAASGGLKVACIERADLGTSGDGRLDGRTMALSFGSRDVVERAGAWIDIAPYSCPIETVRVTEDGGPALLEFVSREAGGKTLGWIAEVGVIRAALFKAARNSDNLDLFSPCGLEDFETSPGSGCVSLKLSGGRTLSARLLVGADGRGSAVRERMGVRSLRKSYRQRAIICTVLHEHSHGNVAIEDFRSEGPFAILPMTDTAWGEHRSTAVWTEHEGRRGSAMEYPESVFEAALKARFPQSYGAVRLAGPRFFYPLTLIHAGRYVGERTALIADAAHGIHPIAAQGLNLGLRDADCLADLVRQETCGDPGRAELLARYERARRFDNTAMAAVTDALNALFSNGLSPVAGLRKAGVRMVSKMPAAKRFLMRQAMGL